MCLGINDFDTFMLKNGSMLLNQQFYNSIVNNYSNILYNLSQQHTVIANYINDFITNNLNLTNCTNVQAKYANLALYNPCTTLSNCLTFAQKYFGNFIFPKIMWKFQLIYANWTDPYDLS